MTKNEVLKQIKREERRVETVKYHIANAKRELAVTRKTVAFWKKVLKEMEKKERKNNP